MGITRLHDKTTVSTSKVANLKIKYLEANKFVAVYYIDDSNDYGYAVIGTISNNTISLGTPVSFGNTVADICVLDSTHFVVIYSYAEVNVNAKIGVISGTEISFGSETSLSIGSFHGGYAHVDSLSATSFVLAYKDSSGYSTALIGTVSGTDITFNTPYTVNASYSGSNTNVSVLDSTHFIAIYSDSNGVKAKIGVISGTAISFGDVFSFSSDVESGPIDIAKISSSMVITGSVSDYESGTKTQFHIVNISGTTITSSEIIYAVGLTGVPSIAFLNGNKALAITKDGTNTYCAQFTFSDNEIIFQSYSYIDDTKIYLSVIKNAEQQVVVSVSDSSPTYYSKIFTITIDEESPFPTFFK